MLQGEGKTLRKPRHTGPSRDWGWAQITEILPFPSTSLPCPKSGLQLGEGKNPAGLRGHTKAESWGWNTHTRRPPGAPAPTLSKRHWQAMVRRNEAYRALKAIIATTKPKPSLLLIRWTQPSTLMAEEMCLFSVRNPASQNSVKWTFNVWRKQQQKTTKTVSPNSIPSKDIF